MRRRSVWLITVAAVLLLGVFAATVISAEPSPMARSAKALAGSASYAHIFFAANLAQTPAPDEIIHVIQRGETIGNIARRYGVGVWNLARYNGITNPDVIYVGQPLRIPRSGIPTVVTPSPLPTAQHLRPTTMPTTTACQCEEIVIESPAPGITVTSPITVTGLASSPFQQTIAVAVLDGSGTQIGLASGTITGEYGQQGPFSVVVPFALPANSQPGRIQVYTTSPRDGALEHLSSVSVVLRGAEPSLR
jgi:LysM repeat protein